MPQQCALSSHTQVSEYILVRFSGEHSVQHLSQVSHRLSNKITVVIIIIVVVTVMLIVIIIIIQMILLVTVNYVRSAFTFGPQK